MSEEKPVVTEIVAGDLLALPPHASRVSVAAAWHSAENKVMDLDLAAVAFAEDGTLLDAAYYHNLSTKHSAIRHMGDDKTGLGAEEQDDEVIHVYPKLLPAEIKTVLFVISASGSEQEAMDLLTPSSLQLSVYSSEEVRPTKEGDDGELVEDTEADPIVRNEVVLKKADLKHFLDPNASHEDLGDQFKSHNQSLLVCALCKLKNSDAWTVQVLGKPSDKSSWGYMIPAMKECLKETPEAKPKLIRVNPEEYIAVSRKTEDRSVDDMIKETHLVATEPLPQEPAQSEKLRFDIGWNYWPPKKKEKQKIVNEDGEEVEVEDEEEVPEPPALDYAFVVYDFKGEKIATIDGGNGEADGMRVLGEDDLEKDLETGTGRDSIGFAVKASVLIEMASLPAEARSIVVVATQFTEGGFKAISGVHGRLVEVLPPVVDPDAKPKKSEDDEEEQEEAPPAKPRFRDLASYHFDSKENEDEGFSAMVICKLYREFKHSAYWTWRGAGVTSMAEFVQGSDVKDILKEVQKQKAAKDEQEKVVEEEDADEDAPKSRMKAEDWQWRVRSLGLKFKGGSLDDMERALLDVATYEGRRDEEGLRHDRQAKCFFANGDTYFGEYEADQKHGLGIYIFSNGGAFSGEYVSGKRHGQGVLMFPDGSCYEGAFANDKFEGRGMYTYADGSVYIGEWKAGKKDGQGVYWYPGFDSCLRGEWKDGYAHGTVRHETSRYEFEGQFDRGVPEGVGKFVISAEDRLAGQRKAAAEFLLHDFGPSLSCTGKYNCPVPTDEDAPPPEEEEEGGENAGPRIPNPELRKKNAAFAHIPEAPVQVRDPVYPDKAIVREDIPEDLAKKLGLDAAVEAAA